MCADVVRLRKAGNILQVIPDCYTQLGSVLQCRRRVQRGSRSRDTTYETVKLYSVRTDKVVGRYLVTFAGLRSRVIKTLKGYGIACTYEDVRPVRLPEPDWSAVGALREGQGVILANIAARDMGQIEAPTGEGKTWLIVQVCKIYPQARIVIVTPGIPEAKTVRDRLLGELPIGQIGQLGGGRYERDRRVTICVRNSLKKADLTSCDLLMYDECHTAGGAKTARLLTHANSCKMFGFSASTEMRTDRADLMVEALFGPVVHQTTYQESQARGNIVPIMVVMRSVPTGPSCVTERTDTLNRHCLWRNDVRNRLIAGDMAEFSAGGKQVLVSVATVEHALEIHRHDTSDFTLVYANMDKNLRLRYEKRNVIRPGDHPIPDWQRARLQTAFEKGQLKKVLTTCWARGVDFPQLEVVIRAEGLAANIRSVQIPGRVSRTYEGKEFGIVVDYMDQWHPTLYRRAQERVRRYRKQKWIVELPEVPHLRVRG